MTREEFTHSSSDTQANLELSEIAQLTDSGFPGCGNANTPAAPGPRTPSVPLPCSRYRYSMSTTETRTFRSRHSRCCMGTAAVLLSLLTIGGFLGIMIHFTVIDVLWKDSSSKPKVPVPRAETSLGNTVPDFLGSVKISNSDWSYKLGVSDSLQYRDLAVRVELELDRVFLLSPLKDIYNFSLVRTFRRGSIVSVFETVLTEHRALTATKLKEAMTKGLDNRKYIRGPDDVIKNKQVVILDAESIQIVTLSTTTLREESTTYTLPMIISTGESSVPTTTTHTPSTTSNNPSSTTNSQIVTTAKDIVYDHSDHDQEVTSAPSTIPSWFWTPWRGTHFTPRIPSVATVTTSDLAHPHTVSAPSTKSPHENVPVSKSSTVSIPVPTVSLTDDHRGYPTSQKNWSFLTSTKLSTIGSESVRPVTSQYPTTQPWKPYTTQSMKIPPTLVTKPQESTIKQNSNTTVTTVTSTQRPSVTSSINIDQIIDSIPGLSWASNEPTIQTDSKTNTSLNPKANTSMSVSLVTVPSNKNTTSARGYFSVASSSKVMNTTSTVRPPTTVSTFSTTSTNESTSSSNTSNNTDSVVDSRNQIPDTGEHYPVLNNTRVSKTNVTNVIETIPHGESHTEHPENPSVSQRIPSTNVHGQSPQDNPVWRDTTMHLPVHHPITRPSHTNWHYPGTRPVHSNGHGFAVRDYVSSEPTATTPTRRKAEVTRRQDILQHGSNIAQDREFWAEGDSETMPSTTHPFPDYMFTDEPDEMYDYMPRFPNNVANVFPNDADTAESTPQTPGRNIFEADDVEHPEHDVTEGIHTRAQFDDKLITRAPNNSQTNAQSVEHLSVPKENTSVGHMLTTRRNPVTTTVSRFAGHHTETSSSVFGSSTVKTLTDNDLKQKNGTETHTSHQVSPSSLTDLNKLNESIPQINTAKPDESLGVSTMSEPATTPPSTPSTHPVPAEYRAKVNATDDMDIKGVMDVHNKNGFTASKLSSSSSSELVSTSGSLETSKYGTVTPVIEQHSTDAGVLTEMLSTVKETVTVYSHRSASATAASAPTTSASTAISVDTSSSEASSNTDDTTRLSSTRQRVGEPNVADYEAFNRKLTPVLTQVPKSLSHVMSASVNPTITVTSTRSTATTTPKADDKQRTSDEKEIYTDNKTRKDNKKLNANANVENPEPAYKESKAEQKTKVDQEMNVDGQNKKHDAKETIVAVSEDEAVEPPTPSSTIATQSVDGVDLFSSLLASNVLTSMYTASVSTSSTTSTSTPVLVDQSYKGSSKGKHEKAMMSVKMIPTSTVTYHGASKPKATNSRNVLSSSSVHSTDLQDLVTLTDELVSVTSHVISTVDGQFAVGGPSVSGFIDATSVSGTVEASVSMPTDEVSHSKEQEISDPYSAGSGGSSKPKIPLNACLDITVMTEFIPTCLDYFSRIMHTEDDLERCQHFLAGVICVTDEFYKYSGQQCSESEISAFIKQHAGLFKNALPNFDPLQCVI